MWRWVLIGTGLFGMVATVVLTVIFALPLTVAIVHPIIREIIAPLGWNPYAIGLVSFVASVAAAWLILAFVLRLDPVRRRIGLLGLALLTLAILGSYYSFSRRTGFKPSGEGATGFLRNPLGEVEVSDGPGMTKWGVSSTPMTSDAKVVVEVLDRFKDSVLKTGEFHSEFIRDEEKLAEIPFFDKDGSAIMFTCAEPSGGIGLYVGNSTVCRNGDPRTPIAKQTIDLLYQQARTHARAATEERQRTERDQEDLEQQSQLAERQFDVAARVAAFGEQLQRDRTETDARFEILVAEFRRGIQELRTSVVVPPTAVLPAGDRPSGGESPDARWTPVAPTGTADDPADHAMVTTAVFVPPPEEPPKAEVVVQAAYYSNMADAFTFQLQEKRGVDVTFSSYTVSIWRREWRRKPLDEVKLQKPATFERTGFDLRVARDGDTATKPSPDQAAWYQQNTTTGRWHLVLSLKPYAEWLYDDEWVEVTLKGVDANGHSQQVLLAGAD